VRRDAVEDVMWVVVALARWGKYLGPATGAAPR